MKNLLPIKRGVYTLEEGLSPNRLAEASRILMMVLYRLDLILFQTASGLLMQRQRLANFGSRRYKILKDLK